MERTNMPKTMMTLLFCFALCVAGCSSSDEDAGGAVNKTPGELILTRTQKQMVDKGNQFAFNLLHEVDRQSEASYIITPLSVGYLLGMLNDGASSTTRSEIMDVLGFGNANAEAVDSYFENMLINAPVLDAEVDLSVANALFLNNNYGITFTDKYVESIQQHYLACVESLDFNDVDASVNHINGWCAEKTRNQIGEFLSKNQFNPNALNYLLNSVYFKADWTTRFEQSNTVSGQFVNEKGEAKTLPMMTKTDSVGYMADDDVKAVSLPYGQGSYRMVLLLPNGKSERTIESILRVLKAERFAQVCNAMKQERVDLQIPRFETNSDINLTNILQELGVKHAFGDGNFSNAVSENDGKFCIGEIKQKAKIEVSESGTKAAAITGGWIYTDPDNSQLPTFTFHATSPFVYVIYEQTSGAIFFMGVYSGEE